MSKAKLILSAVAMFALIGGTLAFKASRSLQPVFEVDKNNPDPALRLCTKATFSSFTTNPALATAPATNTHGFHTQAIALPACPAILLYPAN